MTAPALVGALLWLGCLSMSYRKSLALLIGALTAGSAMFMVEAPLPALGQMVLPGAVAPAPAGTVASPGGAKKRAASGEDEGARGPAIAPKLPTEDAIVGKTLYLDGARSTISFERSGSDLRVAKLTLVGDRLSRSGEACRVDVSGSPMKTSPRESEAGLHRYQVEFPACPFTFDVLDGAVLVTNEGKACELRQADCRSDPTGLWGIGNSEFDPKKSKEFLGARARVEKKVRADFRALYARNKSDRPLRKLIVREQAGFSSDREEICRNYAAESDYGYCALRVTEARALTLGMQLAKGIKRPADLDAQEAAEEAARKKPKGKARGGRG